MFNGLSQIATTIHMLAVEDRMSVVAGNLLRDTREDSRSNHVPDGDSSEAMEEYILQADCNEAVAPATGERFSLD